MFISQYSFSRDNCILRVFNKLKDIMIFEIINLILASLNSLEFIWQLQDFIKEDQIAGF